MGNRFALGRDLQIRPEIAPVTDRPPTFDPLAGFPRGRKVREMKVTWQDMEDWHLTVDERDYCAHKIIPAKRCMYENFPIANYMCTSLVHAWHQCEYEDHLMRMKEFERERRLLKRLQRKREAASKEAERYTE